jgi:hypothetical protein
LKAKFSKSKNPEETESESSEDNPSPKQASLKLAGGKPTLSLVGEPRKGQGSDSKSDSSDGIEPGSGKEASIAAGSSAMDTTTQSEMGDSDSRSSGMPSSSSAKRPAKRFEAFFHIQLISYSTQVPYRKNLKINCRVKATDDDDSFLTASSNASTSLNKSAAKKKGHR